MTLFLLSLTPSHNDGESGSNTNIVMVADGYKLLFR